MMARGNAAVTADPREKGRLGNYEAEPGENTADHAAMMLR
jgi:hypothetical protein